MRAHETEHPGWLAVALGRLALAGLGLGLAARDVLGLLFQPGLLRAHLSLVGTRWRRSPYRWDPGFDAALAAAAAGVDRRALTFGATPVFTAGRLLAWAGLGPGDRLLDVGAGRGGVLLAARARGAEARGVELAGGHVAVAEPILESVGARLEAGDAADADLDGVTHVFAAWTLFPDPLRARLAQRWLALAPGAKVVTIGGPIEAEGFEALGTRSVWVPWGLERAHLHRRRDEGAD